MASSSTSFDARPSPASALEQLSTYELQLKVDELRKRLSTLDEFGNSTRDEDALSASTVRGSKEAEKETSKAAILSAMETAINLKVAQKKEAKVVVHFPHIKGGFSVELPGSNVTWADIRDRACVMFGQNPNDSLIVELRHGQQVLVPGWMKLEPGQRIDADIVDKPPVISRTKSLRSRDSSFRRLNKYASSGASFGSSARGDGAGGGGVHFPEDLTRLLNPAEIERKRIASRREIVCDFFIHAVLFIVLSLGLVDPVNVGGPLRWFERSLSWWGHLPYASTRSGEHVSLSFDTNATSMSEAWDWIEGPLSVYLGNSTSTALPMQGAYNPSWFGETPSDVCPVVLNDKPPLCVEMPFSLPSPSKTRWITSSVSTEIIGSVRLRQFRVRPDSCENKLTDGQEVFPECFADYSGSSRDTSSYGPGVCGFEWRSERELAVDRPGAPTVVGFISSYDSSGFVLDVTTPDQWKPALEYLKNNTWVTAATKAIIVEFTVLNPSEELYASMRALIEIDRTGSATTSLQVSPMRIPLSSLALEVRFITDIIALVFVLILLVRVLVGGFFFKPKQRIWRTYDFIFCLLFIASFGVDMGMYANIVAWENNFSPSTTMYWSLDQPHYYVETANRFRAIIVLLITLRFLFQGTFSLSRLMNVVLSRLLCIYILLLILLIPFMAALTVLVMVLEQGSEDHVVTFGSAIRDLFLVVTGVTDRFTAATPRVGRQSGWSVVFYLFLITFTWVLIVPTLIAFAVITYERAAADKDNELTEDTKKARGLGRSSEALGTTSFKDRPSSQDLSFEKDPVQAVGAGPVAEAARAKAELKYELDHEKSAAQTLVEDLATGVDRLGDRTWRRLKTFHKRPTGDTNTSS